MTPDPAERVQHLLDLDRYAEARDAAARLLAAEPDDPEAHVLLGHALIGCGEPDAALTVGERAVALSPDEPDGHLVRCSALLGLHRVDDAYSAAREVVRLAPAVADGHALLARICAVTRPRWPEGWEAAQHAVRLAPEDPDTHVVLGQAAELRHDLDRAEEAYRTALRLDPQHAEATLALARVDPLSALGDHAAGVAAALRLDPFDPVAAAAADGWLDRAARRAWLGSVAALLLGLLVGVGGLAAVVLLVVWWVRLVRGLPPGIRQHLRARGPRDLVLLVVGAVSLLNGLGAIVATLGPDRGALWLVAGPWLVVTGVALAGCFAVRWWRRPD